MFSPSLSIILDHVYNYFLSHIPLQFSKKTPKKHAPHYEWPTYSIDIYSKEVLIKTPLQVLFICYLHPTKTFPYPTLRNIVLNINI
uniref:Uncharacterized protein n=1 Tax=Octopus bimaculoides TaxID=37653 RepID=A0A0L8HRD7_OCTBM